MLTALFTHDLVNIPIVTERELILDLSFILQIIL